jgi:poly(3-hydroxybutyrate) depolymerase
VHDICSGVPKKMQSHYEAEGAGHYGIFSGRRWRDNVYPQVRDFILDNHQVFKQKSAPTPAKSAPAATKKVARKRANPTA